MLIYVNVLLDLVNRPCPPPRSSFIDRAMLTGTRPRFYAPWGAAVILIATIILRATPVFPLGVKAQADRGEVEVGERLTVTVVGTRSDIDGDPKFLGASVQAPPAWQRGGQSAQSARFEDDHWVKAWQFELIASMPGSTLVTPVVYLANDPALGGQADSVLGAPVAVVILPPPAPMLWPWFLGAALVAVGTVYFVSRSLRRRREAAYQRRSLPPLEEALEMLEGTREDRREDRARQYLGDIERVVHGYLTRKLGEPLGGRTANEIADVIAAQVSDTECVEELRGIMTHCSESKFSGGRIEFDTIAGLEDQVRRVLERLDRSWV